VRGGLEGGLVHTDAGLEVKLGPRTGLAVRLALGIALSICGETAQAQSAAQTSPEPSAPAASTVAQPTAAAADAPAAAGEQAKADSTSADVKLPGVSVQGKRNVFEENDKKLKELQDSLPCNGCDATPHVKKKLVARVLNAVGERVLPTPAPDHSNRDPNDKAEEYSQQDACNAANPGGCIQSNLKP
jgi:hypothetical protein